MYQVISRRYRPQTFASVMGQEGLVTTLQKALTSGKIAHAYLFCGTKGTGKTTCARLLAKALNCKELTQYAEPCNACISCTEIASGKSMDVLEIDGASHRGIDNIRQLNETVGYAPSSGKYKIYIIDEVHMLTKEAFNALLKTLEEPPRHVKFIFATTEPHKVPPTILSRCQRFDLRRIGSSAMEEKLRIIIQDAGAKIEDTALQLIINKAEGSLRDAESLLDQILCASSQGHITEEVASSILGVPPKQVFLDLDLAVQNSDLAFAFSLSDKLFSAGGDISQFMEALMEHLRQILCELLAGKKHPVYTQEHCLYLLDFLIDWQGRIANLPFKRLCVEMGLLHIVRSTKRISIDTLVKRLEELTPSTSQPTHTPIQPQKSHAEPDQISLKTIHSALLPQQTPIQSQNPKPIPDQAPIETTQPSHAGKEKSAYDTLMRFAAIELEGTIIT